ncbi:GH18890 [Drosophila grimshawi]|uniref:GH18890 n=1 Tax=Drosophila grimshawi TaxID=7222 RepID=B4JGR3_DROGR|nr:GH18890 [Drosophila grimshawi]
MVHRAYALFSLDLSKVNETNKTITPFNPSNDKQLKRLQLLGASKLLTNVKPTNMLIAPLLGAPKLLMPRAVNNNLFELPKLRLCSCQDYVCTCCVGIGAVRDDCDDFITTKAKRNAQHTVSSSSSSSGIGIGSEFNWERGALSRIAAEFELKVKVGSQFEFGPQAPMWWLPRLPDSQSQSQTQS